MSNGGIADALWRDSEGAFEVVQVRDDVTTVVRGAGYTRPGSVACELKDSGNGFIVRFPADGSTYQDHYVTLDYAQARELVLALSAHRRCLGFQD